MEERVTIYLTDSPVTVLLAMMGLGVIPVSLIYKVIGDYIPISIHSFCKAKSKKILHYAHLKIKHKD